MEPSQGAGYPRGMRRNPRLEGQDLQLWRALLRVSQLLPLALEQGLAAEDESLPRYEILAVLAVHPEGLRFTDLGRFGLVSKPRLSVHVNELIEEGLIAREAHPTDGRAAVLNLTQAGRRHLAKLTPGHLQLARSVAIDQIDPKDRPVVLRALASMLAALGDSWRPEG
jgi:DNA-binding MarR family transcriptional regulator